MLYKLYFLKKKKAKLSNTRKVQKYEIKLNQSLIIHFFMHSFFIYFFNEKDNAF